MYINGIKLTLDHVLPIGLRGWRNRTTVQFNIDDIMMMMMIIIIIMAMMINNVDLVLRYNCDPPRDLGHFGVDTRTTCSHGKAKETRFNTEQPCPHNLSLKFSFAFYNTIETKE